MLAKRLNLLAFLIVCIAAANTPASAGDLTDAIKLRDVVQVRSLLATSADVQEKVLGDYPLNVAALFGPAEMVSVLLEAGAELERPGRGGMHPLHNAAVSGHKDIVDMLLRKGAFVDAQDKKGSTPLHKFACGGAGNIEIAELLLAAGADPGKADDGEQIPSLRCAAITGDTALGRALIAAGADVNQGDEGGRTALIAAAYYLHHDFVRMLIEAGANVNQATVLGHTALSEAPDDPSIRKLLIDAGAN